MENILTINDCEVLIEALDKYEKSKEVSPLFDGSMIPFSPDGDSLDFMAKIKQEMERVGMEKMRAYEEAKETSTLLKAKLITFKKELKLQEIAGMFVSPIENTKPLSN